ncbi:MAG: peptide ABC transporter substrate-binding protein [Desulfobacterales bacterium]|nr:peptide ABC transporter substrate-binding protein [Desulfobacterales bacterium]
MVKRKIVGPVGVFALFLGVLALMLGASSDAVAKSRLSVGFTANESMETLICDENWQYAEQASVFWPQVYDQLWILGEAPEYKATPRLATRWETKDKKTWTFYLNKNAKFHDGKPVTAHDVIFSIVNLPKADPAWDFPDVALEGHKVIDDHTLEITLDHVHGGPRPPVYWYPVLPKHIWEPHKDKMLEFSNEKAVGSGPFKLKEFKGGEFVWLVKNEDYYGPKPNFDEVVFKSYGSMDALYIALKSGKIDMIGYRGVTTMAVADFKKMENMKVLSSPGIEINWLSFNLFNKTALQDLTVRKAVMHGIDRNRIAKLVFGGYCDVVDSFVYPELAGYNPNLPKYDFNPKLAGEMLEKAGYVDKDNDGFRNDPKSGKNLSFSLMTPSDWLDHVKMARLIKEQMKNIGIDIREMVIDVDAYYEFLYDPKQGKFDISVVSEEPGPHADWIWGFMRGYDNGGEGWNSSYYSNPAFDKAMDSMLSAVDPKKREELLHTMQRIMAEDLPYGVLNRPNRINPVRTDTVTGHVETMGGISTWINPWTYYKASPVK